MQHRPIQDGTMSLHFCPVVSTLIAWSLLTEDDVIRIMQSLHHVLGLKKLLQKYFQKQQTLFEKTSRLLW